MGLYSLLFKPKQDDTNQNNPYLSKYDINKIGVNNVVYLLYCDFADAQRWIKDAKKPIAFFTNYDNALLILKVLASFQKQKKYRFTKPTPTEQHDQLTNDYETIVKKFIVRYWNSVINSAKKLKADARRQKKLQSFFDELENYSSRLMPSHIQMIESLRDCDSVIEELHDNITVKCGRYTLRTIDDIVAIPSSDENVMFPLQKTATEFKRQKRLDLAIACLRKSNDISDRIPYHGTKLTQSQYLRILKYMDYTKDSEGSADEEKNIRKKHPEFWDRRISNLVGINETLNRAKEFKEDLVIVSTNSSCDICKNYNRKIFSISGKSKKYPKLPSEIAQEGGFCPKCYLGLNSYFEDMSTTPKKN